MRRVISFLLCVILIANIFFFFMGCQGNTNKGKDDTEYNPFTTSSVENILVDIATNDNGYYSMTANVSLWSYEGTLSEIYIENPTLLAFSVPDSYTGGVCLVNGEDINSIIQKLKSANEHLSDNESKSYISDVIAFLEQQSIYTYSPT